MQELADRILLLVTICNSAVFAGPLQEVAVVSELGTQEVAVVSDENPALPNGKRELVGIALTSESGVKRGGYIDAVGS